MSISNYLSPQEMSLKHIWQTPMDHFERRLDRIMCRFLTTVAKKYVLSVEGHTQYLNPDRGPFILVLNHNQRHEAILVPALLHFYRQGKPLHFLADWNYLLMPGVSMVYRMGQTIITTRKKAKPRFLNVFKPLFTEPTSAFDRALKRLAAGAPVGIFPEGTINRHPQKLLRGFPGAAKMALVAQVPVVPAGIRFPLLNQTDPRIPDGAKMALHIGQPIQPSTIAHPLQPTRTEVGAFHSRIMQALTDVSGKTWHPTFDKRRSNVSEKN